MIDLTLTSLGGKILKPLLPLIESSSKQSVYNESPVHLCLPRTSGRSEQMYQDPDPFSLPLGS